MESAGDDLPGGRRNESEAAEWSGVEVFSAEVMAGTVTAESDRSEPSVSLIAEIVRS